MTKPAKPELRFALISNADCNRPKHGATALALNLEALLLGKGRLEGPMLEFTSLTELAMQAGYSAHQKTLGRIREALKKLPMLDRVRPARRGATRGRLIIYLDDVALRLPDCGYARVPLPLPKGSTPACKLYLWLFAWQKQGRKARRIDPQVLCRIIGVNVKQSPAGMLRDLKGALVVVNDHLKTLDRAALKNAGITFPRKFRMKQRDKVCFEGVKVKRLSIYDLARSEPVWTEPDEDGFQLDISPGLRLSRLFG